MLKHLLIVIISITLFACGSKPKAADDTRYVKTFIIGENVGQSLSTLHGNIHAEFEPNLSFRVEGKIINRKVDIGQVVKKGEVLAQLDPSQADEVINLLNPEIQSEVRSRLANNPVLPPMTQKMVSQSLKKRLQSIGASV